MNEIPGDYSEDYYANNGQSGDRPALTFFARLAKRYLQPGVILDFGCGTGHFITHLMRRFDVIGVETSDWASEIARRRTGAMVYTSLDDIPDDSIDSIVSIHVVEHIPDELLVGVLNAWRRVMKAGGRVMVVTPDAGGFAHLRKKEKWIALSDPTHINLKPNAEWCALFESCGFRVERKFADGLWDFPYLLPWLGRLEVLLLGWPTLFQFLAARPLIRAGRGESVIMILHAE